MWWLFSKKQSEPMVSRSKAIDVANYIVYLRNFDEKRGQYYSLSNLKMQKLLYYCQGGFYQLYDMPLFEDEFSAWSYGPTLPNVYANFSQYGQNDINEKEGLNYRLNKTEMDAIKMVWERLAKHDAYTLVNATHSETPWINAFKTKEKIISKESIRDFFRRVL